MPKWKGHYTLANADCILVQTEAQRQALQERFGRTAILIRNPVHIAPDNPSRWIPRQQRDFVLWIGRADEFNKRPRLYLDLAANCPELHFVMIVGRTDEAALRALEAVRPNNLRIVGHVPPAEIGDYLARARVFVNTSRFEGFPNTFLQCAVAGVPLVSLEVDPDGILSRHGCGLVARGDPEAMRQAVRRLWDDTALGEALALAWHRLSLERHAAEGRMAEFEACLDAALRAPAPHRLPWWTLARRFAGSRDDGTDKR
jgi:glycosyltransferase involved in cell wall biosynthesis